MSLLPKSAKSDLQRGLAQCGDCRLRLEALRDAGLDVDAEFARLEKAQQVAETFLQLEQKPTGTR